MKPLICLGCNGSIGQGFAIIIQFIKQAIIAYVKDKGGILSTLAQALTSIINYGPLQYLGKGHVLTTLSTKHANMLVLILKFLLVSRRLA